MVKKIACVIGNIAVTGGAERVMTVLCNGFAELGIDVTLIVQQDTRKAYPLDERVHLAGTPLSVKIPVLRSLLRGLKLRKQLKDLQPDAVISFTTWMNCMTLLYTFGLHIPVIVSERVDPRIMKGLRAFLRTISYPHAAGFVFQTEDAMNFFSSKIKARSVVIANPLSALVPQKTSYKPSNTIVSVGRLTKQKNYPLLLRSFREFKKQYPEYSLKIFGAGELKDELTALTESFQLSDSVTLMGSVSDVLEQIKTGDIFALTSDYEGMPNALAEAMAVGLPCIATDSSGGGVRSLIQNKENGILIPAGSQESLVAALCELAGDYEYAANLGKQAKRLNDTLNYKGITAQWLEFINKFVE